MRIDSIACPHLCRTDARDFPCAHGKKDCGAIGGELEGITVATGNENGSAPLSSAAAAARNSSASKPGALAF